MQSERCKKVISALDGLSREEKCEIYRHIAGSDLWKPIPNLVGLPAEADLCIRTMNEVTGNDIRQRSRRRDLVWGRFIVIHELLGKGWSTNAVGNVFGMDHSSVIHGRDCVRMMIRMPKMYPSESLIWGYFKKRLADERMRMEGEPGRQAV